MLARQFPRNSTRSASFHSLSPLAVHATRRHYAQPINPSTSVDPRLGIVPPPAPLAGSASEGKGNGGYVSVSSASSRPNNPNDLSQLLKDLDKHNVSNQSNSSSNPKTATLASVKGTAIGSGAQRRGTAIPSSDLDEFTMLEQEAERRKLQAEAQEEGEHGPVSKTSIIDRESPHSIDQMQGRNELDERILNAARATYATQRGAGLRQLNEEFTSMAYRVLPIELPYESTPDSDRKVPLPNTSPSSSPETNASQKEDDGILLIAFVDNVDAPRGQERISVCTGFGVQGGRNLAQEEGDDVGGELVVTIAHTLRSASGPSPPPPSSSSQSSSEDKSAALAITRSGQVYPVHKLVASLPSCDLVLLHLAREPLPVHSSSSAAVAQSASTATQSSPGIKTLPISPYPAPTQTHLCVSSFWGFEDDLGCALPRFNYQSSSRQLTVLPETVSPPAGRSPADVTSEGDSMSQSRWGEVRLIEYKDGKGSEAQPGTYDSLETLEYKLVKDSRINPAVLRGEKPTYIPANAVSTSGDGGSAALQGHHHHTSTTTATDASQGFGGYGVPNFPPPGSSGGPIVDLSTGAVVGVTRGCKMTTLGGRRGEGIPSEKIFEFFSLPGFKSKSSKSKS